MWNKIKNFFWPWGGCGTSVLDNKLPRMVKKLKSLFKRGDN